MSPESEAALAALVSVRGDVSLRKESSTDVVVAHNFAHPPVGVLLVDDCDDVTPTQFEFFMILGPEVIVCNDLCL